MECPKCGFEIDDNAMFCPNCKKVLKLACPICKTINDTNTCKKCGYVIISKCHKCGKVNQTFSKKCKKCGFSMEKSVIMNESNCDDFAMLTIDFPNLDEMKVLLGSAKLLNKFKINLDNLILKYTKSKGLRRQIINKTCVIRCNRDYTFNSSVNTAIQTAVDLLNLIAELNCKLTKKKNATIRCNMFLLKRNIESDPYNITSGLNINLINQDIKKKEDKILNTFQILTDDDIADAIDSKYPLIPLNSIMVDNEMKMFYEIDLKDSIKVEFPVEDETDEVEVPNFVQNMLIEQDKMDGEAINSLDSLAADADAVYDIKSIDFDEVNCEFLRTENIDATFHIMNIFQNIKKGIVALKTIEMHKPYTIKLLNAAADTEQFDNIITLTCYEEMKYTPYAFFRDLVSAIFEYTVSQKLFDTNDFSMFKSVDPDGLIKDLITLTKRDTEDLEDTRVIYFDIFLTLLQIIPKTLILIEDFDNIDDSSYDVLKFLFEAFEQLDISFLISYDKSFSLHKDCHFLLSKPYYAEITLKPTSFEKLIGENKLYYKNIMNDFYFQRVAKYAYGSGLFIDYAMQYLIESGVYTADEETINLKTQKTIIIPSSLDKLVARRIYLLQDNEVLMKFLTSIMLLGPRIDIPTIESLGYKNHNELIDELTQMGYIYTYNNCIYFPNYNLVKRNLLSTINQIYLKEVAKELFDKVFNDNMPSPIKAYLYNLLNDSEHERCQWEQLADISLSLGDFRSYLNSTERVINILDKNVDPDRFAEFQEYKNKLYLDISDHIYDYIPAKTSDVAYATLKHIEQNESAEKIIELCSRMINGALAAGEYNQSLELMHRVLALLPASSLNPADSNFNAYFFLMSVAHIQILFNVGSLVDCIDIGYKVLNVVNDETIKVLKPEYMSQEDFEQIIIDSAGYVALANILLMQANVADFLNILRQNLSCIPKSFDLFIELQNFVHGQNSNIEDLEISARDRFSEFIYYFINAFNSFDDDSGSFAEIMYKAKLAAKAVKLFQLEYLADMFIAYAYIQLDSFIKAESILYKIIKDTDKKGMTMILYAAWYIMSELHLRQQKFDIAFGIINNSLIQLEKNNSSGEYLLMLFKYNMYKVMMFQKDFEKAQICINHAQYIAQRYSINMQFDTDETHYITADDTSSENIEENVN